MKTMNIGIYMDQKDIFWPVIDLLKREILLFLKCFLDIACIILLYV